jgi:hypothetical protein
MKGALEIRPDEARDKKLRAFAESIGCRSANHFVQIVLALVCRIPTPRYFWRVFGAMETEIEAIKTERKAGRGKR